MSPTTQFKFDTRPTDDTKVVPVAWPSNSLTHKFAIKPTRFQLKKLPFWRVLALLTGLIVLSFLIGFPLASIAIAIGYGFLLEKTITNNALFSGLDNRVFTDENGTGWLEITRKQAMDKFLDAELSLSVNRHSILPMAIVNELIHQETVSLRATARRQGDRYLIPLPLPPSTVLASVLNDEAGAVQWDLQLRYSRDFALDIVYEVALAQAEAASGS